ncbi:hypothetical protein ABT127_20870 [Streptomyces sp. NPDC001904]|uniref:hypothetical protein n=1 Tax=Streptomyces sp. NPDC001904 TaxID=3154531 RepID=UPI00332095B1
MPWLFARALANNHQMDAEATIGRPTGILETHHNGWAGDDTALLALRLPPAS